MAQWAEMTVAECFLTSCVWAHIWIGSHTKPGHRHSQPTQTLLGKRCMLISVQPDTCILAEWPRSFMCLCGITGVEQTPQKSQHRKLTLKKKIPLLLLQDSNSQPFDHASSAQPTSCPSDFSKNLAKKTIVRTVSCCHIHPFRSLTHTHTHRPVSYTHLTLPTTAEV